MFSNDTNYFQNISDNFWNSQKFVYYFQMATISTGILGNTISFIIFIQPHLNRRSKTGFLYAILSVLNVLRILEYDFYLYTHTTNFYGSASIYPCNIEAFVNACLHDALTWMQVLIGFDRFILIMIPKKAFIMTKKVFFYYIL